MQATTILYLENLVRSAWLTVYLLKKPTSFSLRIGNSKASDALHQEFHSVGMLKRGKMSVGRVLATDGVGAYDTNTGRFGALGLQLSAACTRVTIPEPKRLAVGKD